MLQPRKIDVSPSTTSGQLVNAMRQPHAPNETNCVRATGDPPRRSGCMRRPTRRAWFDWVPSKPHGGINRNNDVRRRASGSAATPLANKSPYQ